MRHLSRVVDEPVDCAGICDSARCWVGNPKRHVDTEELNLEAHASVGHGRRTLPGVGQRRADRFIRLVTSSWTYRPDGSVETTKDLAVWTLAHRGYSGGGRLDVWVYPSKAAALLEGARLAMASGLEDDPRAVALFKKGRYQAVLERYEELNPATHLLRVQPAFLYDERD